MYPLYPTIKPYKHYELSLDKPHLVYVEETGNPKGKPVVVLHPGPGSGGDSYLRRFFDPEIYRIILFDQRGCGRSQPNGETYKNTTQDLIADIETIRQYLKIERFILFGGGWGSLLALLYAEAFPQQVGALMLYQIFLGRQRDIDWFYQQGANQIFPDYWEHFIQLVPEKDRQHISQYYADSLKGDNELARMAAAKHWSLWQGQCSSLHPHAERIEQYRDPHFALTLAKLETHYIVHHYFIKENQVLDNAHKIVELPVYLIHGRYDMVCPLGGAWDLHKALPASTLRVIRDANHSDREAGMIDALITVSKEIHQNLDIY